MRIVDVLDEPDELDVNALDALDGVGAVHYGGLMRDFRCLKCLQDYFQ